MSQNNNNSFIEKSKEKHGNKYDYSLVNNVNNRTYVAIICPVHGEFFQIPGNHYKYGCNKCASIFLQDGKKSTYCPDFYLVDENKVIDIKPKWRAIKESCKLRQAEFQFNNKNIKFEIIDCNSIKIDFSVVAELINKGTVFLSNHSMERFKKRFK
jgi:hypothetical protein